VVNSSHLSGNQGVKVQNPALACDFSTPFCFLKLNVKGMVISNIISLKNRYYCMLGCFSCYPNTTHIVEHYQVL